VGRMRKSVMLMTVGESPADRSADNCALSVSQRIAAMINLVDCSTSCQTTLDRCPKCDLAGSVCLATEGQVRF
jgi:hypothetical protein